MIVVPTALDRMLCIGGHLARAPQPSSGHHLCFCVAMELSGLYICKFSKVSKECYFVTCTNYTKIQISVPIKFYEQTVTHSFWDSLWCFPAAATELSSYCRDCSACRPKIFPVWPFTEKRCQSLIRVLKGDWGCFFLRLFKNPWAPSWLVALQHTFPGGGIFSFDSCCEVYIISLRR